jgi:hypothetical protein
MKYLAILFLLAAAATATAQTNRFAATIFNVMTNNLSITNQTNAVTISNLTFATQADARYAVTFNPIFEASTTSTLMTVVASNATVFGFWNGTGTTFGSLTNVTNEFPFSITTVRAANQLFYVLAGTNAGSISVTFRSSVATNTNTIRAGSFMRADRVPQ